MSVLWEPRISGKQFSALAEEGGEFSQHIKQLLILSVHTEVKYKDLEFALQYSSKCTCIPLLKVHPLKTRSLEFKYFTSYRYSEELEQADAHVRHTWSTCTCARHTKTLDCKWEAWTGTSTGVWRASRSWWCQFWPKASEVSAAAASVSSVCFHGRQKRHPNSP